MASFLCRERVGAPKTEWIISRAITDLMAWINLISSFGLREALCVARRGDTAFDQID
jgi:hypothetical protein